jgi:hypothetical protein
MSVIDMFASALGAFIMVAIIIFPYYQKNRPFKQKLDASVAELKRTQEDVDKTKAQGQKLERQNDETKAEIQQVKLAKAELNNQCKRSLAACLTEQGETFLLIKIAWSDQSDVDLHVTDPHGNEFFFLQTNSGGANFPNSKGVLSTDTSSGPGIEVWQVPAVEPGSYKIEYVMENNPGRAITVSGLFFDKAGKNQLPDKIIGNGQLRVLAGTIEVSADKRISLR